VAGNVPFLFDQLAAGLPLAQSGKLKVLAVTSDKRSSLAPEVPTMAEAGVPGFNLVSWHAVYAPKGTPKDVLKKLNEAVVAAVRSPEVKTKLETMFGMELVGSTPEVLTALMKTDIPRLGALVKKTGATAE
jgi:tripartite-type tricarboxylate transporter receptor subunit TctC